MIPGSTPIWKHWRRYSTEILKQTLRRTKLLFCGRGLNVFLPNLRGTKLLFSGRGLNFSSPYLKGIKLLFCGRGFNFSSPYPRGIKLLFSGRGLNFFSFLPKRYQFLHCTLSSVIFFGSRQYPKKYHKSSCCGPFEDIHLNPLHPKCEIQILLCLTPNGFTRQRETN